MKWIYLNTGVYEYGLELPNGCLVVKEDLFYSIRSIPGAKVRLEKISAVKYGGK